jgi:hypothetical protein
MILSFFILVFALTVTAIVVVALIFEFLAQHLSPFLELALPCRTTFAFIISPFTAGGFPAFESLCHMGNKFCLVLLYQDNYSIASNLLRAKKWHLLIFLMVWRFSHRKRKAQALPTRSVCLRREAIARANAPLPQTK